VLRDDAIRAGLIKPTKDDVDRMNLTRDELIKVQDDISKADLVRLGFETEEKPKGKTAKKKIK
jgi:hypothetical protein